MKGSQFRRPLLEFSAACAGCGETPYAKLLTQLYGDRVYWANATGCSQAWGSAMPGIPYTKNQKGQGPAWTNSLFENNAEFALGMVLSVNQQREAQKSRVEKYRDICANAQVAAACDAYLAAFDDFDGSKAAAETLIALLEEELTKSREERKAALLDDVANKAGGKLASSMYTSGFARIASAIGEKADKTGEKLSAVLEGRMSAGEAIAASVEEKTGKIQDVVNALDISDDGEKAKLCREILAAKDQLAKKTFWMYGGDGWAYDIGFGGLDHVLASGENVNVLVVDTEVYSNTGGQSSKATPVGAVAQFAASGKKSPKKDLGSILMTYGNIYVAQVAQGADNAQLVKAVKEAQEYNGPSIIIAYAPCQEHGLKCGAAKVQDEMKKAVDAGYWFLYRYNPDATPKFQLDSKAPSIAYEEFLDGEVRYASLRRTFPENAKTLFAEGAELSRQRYEKLAAMQEK